MKAFFKAVIKREKLCKKIRKKVKLNYILNAKKPLPYRDPCVTRSRSEDLWIAPCLALLTVLLVCSLSLSLC